MPKYDLRCEKCNDEFSVRASISDKTEKRIVCPRCDKNELATVFKSPPALMKAGVKCPDRSGCGSSGCRYQ